MIPPPQNAGQPNLQANQPNVPIQGANVPNDGANQPGLPKPVQSNPDAKVPVTGAQGGQGAPVAGAPGAGAPGAAAAPKAAPASAPGTRTLSIKVTDGSKAASQPHALPLPNEALAKLLDSISTSSLTKGSLPTFTDRALASLTTNYAATPGSGTFTEPADITEKQWDGILKNNRALHGYWYDWDLNILVKASKKGNVGP